MGGRTGVLLMAALALAAAGALAVRARGSDEPSGEGAVTVGAVRVPAADLEAAAARLAGGHPRRLAAARAAAAAREIERLWLSGEATARGLRPAPQLGALRAQVADAVAGRGRVPDAARLAAAFDAFHARWRARTRCLGPYRDPYEDRCGDAAGPAVASCRWMGEATVCGVQGRARWLVVRESPSARATRAAAARLPRRLARTLRSGRGGVVGLRSRADALAIARAVYVLARAARVRAAAQRARAAQRAAAARERDERARDPHLAAQSLASARDACGRQLRDSEPYMFAFGTQDAAGQAQGLIGARTALARRVRAAAADPIDRAKLRPLIAAIAAGNHELQRLAAGAPSPDLTTLRRRNARLDARTEPERAISRRLGLGDCLARPAKPE